MLTKNIENRNQVEFVSLEQMVPQDHLLRQIDAAIDFNKVYEFVEDLCCKDNGRPSIDPVVLFKIVLLQHIYGIRSLRRTLEEIRMNMAYRWFIGYPLNEQVPHFSTVSYNFKHRFNTASVEYIFRSLGRVYICGRAKIPQNRKVDRWVFRCRVCSTLWKLKISLYSQKSYILGR